jgi:hypothetical protein
LVWRRGGEAERRRGGEAERRRDGETGDIRAAADTPRATSANPVYGSDRSKCRPKITSHKCLFSNYFEMTVHHNILLASNFGVQSNFWDKGHASLGCATKRADRHRYQTGTGPIFGEEYRIVPVQQGSRLRYQSAFLSQTSNRTHSHASWQGNRQGKHDVAAFEHRDPYHWYESVGQRVAE